MIIFDEQWFEKYQQQLLWFLNKPIINRIAKYIFRIRKHDIGYNKPIIQITPYSYTVLLRKINKKHSEVAIDVRTHNKYAKRLYYSFYWLWKIIHVWDIYIANVFIPRFNLGFDSFTVYPDTGSGSTTVDGRVYRSTAATGEVFSTITTSAGTTAATSDATGDVAFLQTGASSTSNQFNTLVRGFFTFNTNQLNGAYPSSVVFSYYGSLKQNGLGSPDYHVAGVNLTAVNNIATADYLLRLQNSFGSIAYASWSTTGYNDVTLNNSGRESVNKNGITQFSVQTSWDINNSFTGAWALSSNSGFSGYFADQTGTTNDPKLTVTYLAANRNFFYLRQGFQ